MPIIEHQKGLGVPPQDYVMFWCEPCNTHHQVPVTGPKAWGFNGSLEKPTITPSLMVTYEYKEGRPTKRCHTNVTDGMIQYHTDCTHDMAGKIVALPELP